MASGLIMKRRTFSFLTSAFVLLATVTTRDTAEALSSSSSSSIPGSPSSSSPIAGAATTIPSVLTSPPANNNVLILDHLNINHERGRHDLVKAFYFDFLQCAVDPRKSENIAKGKKTLWANIGSQQFHLPEGTPNAQVLDGVITLAYPSLKDVMERYESNVDIQSTLSGSEFSVERIMGDDEHLRVVDPWGTVFRLIQDDRGCYVDDRGKQIGSDDVPGIAMTDLTIHVPTQTNFEGIGRFYESVLGAPCLSVTDDSCVIGMGPKGQTLTFVSEKKAWAGGQAPKKGLSSTSHVDLVEMNLDDDDKEGEQGVANYGPHVSLYLADLPSAYRQADRLGLTYVNPRFKRRAFNLDEAIDQCMFRCLHIVDPDHPEEGPILSLEHEVRSVLKGDGSMYKSCPFDSIPDGCVSCS